MEMNSQCGVVRGVGQDRRGPAVSRADRGVVISLFGEPGDRCAVDITGVDPFCCARIARDDVAARDGIRRDRFEERPTDVDVVEERQLLRLSAEIGHFINDLTTAGTGDEAQSRSQPPARAEHRAFVHDADQFDRPFPDGIDSHFDAMSRDVGDPSVQRQFLATIVARWPHESETTTTEQFIEAVQPTESASILQVDERRMNGSLDGRLPFEWQVVKAALPDSHAASRQDR